MGNWLLTLAGLLAAQTVVVGCYVNSPQPSGPPAPTPPEVQTKVDAMRSQARAIVAIGDGLRDHLDGQIYTEFVVSRAGDASAGAATAQMELATRRPPDWLSDGARRQRPWL
jgi:hypothetical protein